MYTPSLEINVSPLHDTIGVDSKAGTTQICATIQACELPDDDDSIRAPVDIVVVLDVSGSMSGSKLALCKKTLELLVRELRHEDRLGIVAFSDEARLEVPARKVANKEAILHKINALQAGGCTNISGAIGLAAEEIHAVENPNGVRAVFLLTDGHANVGISDSSGIVDLTRSCIGRKDDAQPITIHTFGYGSDHDETLLRSIAGATSGGCYYFVENDANVKSAFGEALGGILSVVAQNAIVTISVPPEAAALGVEIVSVHHQSKVKNEDGSFSINTGDFYAEESRDVLFDVSLATGMKSASSSDGNRVAHASVSLSYVDALKKEPANAGAPKVAFITRPPGSEKSHPSRYVALQWLRVQTTEGMEDAERISRSGNLPAAREKIKSLIAHVRAYSSGLGADDDPLVAQLLGDLNRVLAGLATVREYNTYGAKYMTNRVATHSTQRAMDARPDSSTVYRGKVQRSMQVKFAGA